MVASTPFRFMRFWSLKSTYVLVHWESPFRRARKMGFAHDRHLVSYYWKFFFSLIPFSYWYWITFEFEDTCDITRVYYPQLFDPSVMDWISSSIEAKGSKRRFRFSVFAWGVWVRWGVWSFVNGYYITKGCGDMMHYTTRWIGYGATCSWLVKAESYPIIQKRGCFAICGMLRWNRYMVGRQGYESYTDLVSRFHGGWVLHHH